MQLRWRPAPLVPTALVIDTTGGRLPELRLSDPAHSSFTSLETPMQGTKNLITEMLSFTNIAKNQGLKGGQKFRVKLKHILLSFNKLTKSWFSCTGTDCNPLERSYSSLCFCMLSVYIPSILRHCAVAKRLSRKLNLQKQKKKLKIKQKTRTVPFRFCNRMQLPFSFSQ